MKEKHLAIIVTGFILLGAGMAMLALSSIGEETGFIFAFPFAITGGLGPVAEVVILIITLGISLWFAKGVLDLIQNGGLEDVTRLHTRYLRVDSLCDHCESPVPSRASFCPSCGRPVDGWQKSFENED
ncbi:MAG: zinc ribbon domain-containing protein [Candidatus Thorarchaeota archaeon]